MIGRLRGTLLEKQPPEILIEVSGVGYEVNMPMTCFYKLPKEGEEAIVYTHFVVREDAQLLFGFRSKTGLGDFIRDVSRAVCCMRSQRRCNELS